MRELKKAFTLVELLVVIAIIALLLSILMPALNKVRKQARSVVCSTKLHHMNLAFMLYTENNNAKFTTYKFNGNRGEFWMEALRKYYADINKMRFCAEATKRDPNPAIDYGDTFLAWGNSAAWFMQKDEGSYGFNSWLHDPYQMEAGALNYGPGEAGYFKTMNAKNASEIPVIFDCKFVNTWPLDTDLPPRWKDRMTGYYDAGTIGHMARSVMPRHGWAIDVMFLDGSCRKVTLEELWKLRWHKNFKPKEIKISKPNFKF